MRVCPLSAPLGPRANVMPPQMLLVLMVGVECFIVCVLRECSMLLVPMFCGVISRAHSPEVSACKRGCGTNCMGGGYGNDTHIHAHLPIAE